MKKEGKAAIKAPGYFLSEEQQQQLDTMRDQMYLLMDFVLAVTQDEEDEPLRIQRSKLGKLFESFGLQLDKVLNTLPRASHS